MSTEYVRMSASDTNATSGDETATPRRPAIARTPRRVRCAAHDGHPPDAAAYPPARVHDGLAEYTRQHADEDQRRQLGRRAPQRRGGRAALGMLAQDCGGQTKVWRNSPPLTSPHPPTLKCACYRLVRRDASARVEGAVEGAQRTWRQVLCVRVLLRVAGEGVVAEDVVLVPQAVVP